MYLSDIKNWLLGYNLKDGITNAATVMFITGSIITACTTNNIWPKSLEKYGQTAIAISISLGLIVSGKSGNLQRGQDSDF